MFCFYGKRIVKSPVFWLCVVLLTVLMLLGCYEDLGAVRANHLSVFYCFQVANSIGISHVLVPVVVVVPFLFFFVDELEKGALYYQLVRSRKNTCYGGQIGAAVVSSMAVTLLAVTLFTVVCVLLGADWKAEESQIQGFQGAYFLGLMQERLWLLYGIYVFDFMVYSMSWVLVGMVLSVFTKHRYLILCGPFLFYMAVNCVTELSGLMWLNPDQTLLKGVARGLPGGGLYYALAYHLGMGLVLALIYWSLSKRRYYREGI